VADVYHGRRFESGYAQRNIAYLVRSLVVDEKGKNISGKGL
jgi:hypothetical protein